MFEVVEQQFDFLSSATQNRGIDEKIVKILFDYIREKNTHKVSGKKLYDEFEIRYHNISWEKFNTRLNKLKSKKTINVEYSTEDISFADKKDFLSRYYNYELADEVYSVCLGLKEYKDKKYQIGNIDKKAVKYFLKELRKVNELYFEDERKVYEWWSDTYSWFSRIKNNYINYIRDLRDSNLGERLDKLKKNNKLQTYIKKIQDDLDKFNKLFEKVEQIQQVVKHQILPRKNELIDNIIKYYKQRAEEFDLERKKEELNLQFSELKGWFEYGDNDRLRYGIELTNLLNRILLKGFQVDSIRSGTKNQILYDKLLSFTKRSSKEQTKKLFSLFFNQGIPIRLVGIAQQKSGYRGQSVTKKNHRINITPYNKSYDPKTTQRDSPSLGKSDYDPAEVEEEAKKNKKRLLRRLNKEESINLKDFEVDNIDVYSKLLELISRGFKYCVEHDVNKTKWLKISDIAIKYKLWIPEDKHYFVVDTPLGQMKTLDYKLEFKEV